MTLKLENFEGPIELLYQLVQQQEMDIYEIPLLEITEQFMEYLLKNPQSIDEGAEFISLTAALLWLKSKTLLPVQDQVQVIEEIEEEPHLQMMHHLVDYCRFKEVAKMLSSREEKQQGYYSRGMNPFEPKKPLGIEHLTLDDLVGLFKVVAAKSSSNRGIVEAETWKLSDKLLELRALLQEIKKIPFDDLFCFSKIRLELIVTFLAVLELMKSGELAVIKETATEELFVVSIDYFENQ